MAIARAVIARPKLLLADEPTGNVDDRMAMRLMHLFEELNKLGTTIVIATHNETLAGRLGHPRLRLDAGWLDAGTPDQQAAGKTAAGAFAAATSKSRAEQSSESAV